MAAGEQAARRTPESSSTVERALDVLLLFARSPRPDHGVTEIAATMGLSKAVVHRILTSLRSRELVSFDPGTRRYALGPAALSLGHAYTDRLDVRTLAAPELAWLSERAQETATLSIRNGDVRTYVDQVLPDREIRMEVTLGARYPLHAGSSSKAFLAFLPDSEMERYLAGASLPRLTGQTITDPDRLRRDLRATRERGYATSLGERQEGAASIAAPVLDHTGLPVAVLSVAGPLERLRPHVGECAALVLQATARLAARLGTR